MASTLSSPTTTSFLPKIPQLSSFKKQTTSVRVACAKISCNINTSTTNNNNNNNETPILSDRRGILIGLGGMSCGAALALGGWPTKAEAAGESVTFPKPLDSVIKTTLSRPRTTRSKTDKEAEEEVLLIKFDVGQAKQYITFDVYVNDDDVHQVGEKTDIKAQYAGSFTTLAQKEGDSVGVTDGKKKPSQLKLALSRLLEDLDASNDESIDVTIVPNPGAAQSVTITDVGIEFAAE